MSPPLVKKKYFSSGERAALNSDLLVETIPGAKIYSVVPGGFCPKYSPLTTITSLFCAQIYIKNKIRITNPASKTFLFITILLRHYYNST
jgi:hypothetical protein